MSKVKKLITFILLFILSVIVFCVFYIFFYNKMNNPRIEEYCLTDYRSVIERFPSDECLGAIDNIETAKESVNQLLERHYGKDILQKYKYAIIAYDNESDTWRVSCSLISPIERLYGRRIARTPSAIVQSDGKVLAIWD